MKIPRRIGEVLIDSGILTQGQLSEALQRQKISKKFLGQELVDLGFITEDRLELILAKQFGSKLGEILLKNKMIAWQQLSFALKLQEESHKPLGQILVKLGYITEENLIQAISEEYGIEHIKLSEYKVNPEALKKLPKDLCRFYNILPIDIQGDTLVIAMSDPGNIIALDDARVVSGMNIKAVVASYEGIKSYFG